MINVIVGRLFVTTFPLISKISTLIDSAFYPLWDGKMSISFRAE